MPDGPVIYGTLVDETAAAIRTATSMAFQGHRADLEEAARTLEGRVIDRIARDAYMAGVRDGFAQGVQAESDAAARRRLERDTPPAITPIAEPCGRHDRHFGHYWMVGDVTAWCVGR